jgi:type I restriction enzyme S subunit
MKNGWQIVPMGQLCSIKSGKSDTKDAVEDGPYAFFDRSRTIKKSSRYLYECEALIIPGEGTEFLPKHFVGKFDLHQRAYALFDFSDRIDVKFLYYFLHHLCDYFPRVAVGATVKSLRLRHFEQLPVALTGFSEQRRIVGILDEAFEGIATATGNAAKNLQNARAIFENHLQFVFTQRDLGWIRKALKEVCEKITDGTHQTPTYFDDGIVFLSSRNVTSGRITWDDTKYIDAKQHLEMHKRVAPRLNDVLLAKNGTTGVAAIVDRDTTFDIYVSLALLRARDEILPKFLLHFVNSPVAKQQFNKRLKGIGVPNLHLEEIREVSISFPRSLDEQAAVVTSIDGLREQTLRLESIYRQKLAALEALKKSLLHQAFTGEL